MYSQLKEKIKVTWDAREQFHVYVEHEAVEKEVMERLKTQSHTKQIGEKQSQEAKNVVRSKGERKQ